MPKLGWLVGVALVFFAGAAGADDWVRPEPTSYHSRGFAEVAEIFPPNSRQNPGGKPLCFFYAIGYPGIAWQIDARLAWKGPLVNESMPYQALVSPEGDLVTLNEHGSVGYRNAVVLYGRNGTLVKAYALEDLIPASELESWEHDGKVSLSTSSRWWTREAKYYFLAEPRRVAIFLPWAYALEIPLDGSPAAYGPVESFAALAALRRKEAAAAATGHFGAINEEVEVWATSLRFSSITDVLTARAGLRRRLPP
jgi:hypothetical protein